MSKAKARKNSRRQAAVSLPPQRTAADDAPVNDRAARYWRLTAVLSAAVFLVLAGWAARLETPTVDEFAHLPAGCAYWTQQRFDLYAKNPPLMKMAMAVPPLIAGARVPEFQRPMDAWTPWLYGYDFLRANESRYLTLFALARLIPILCVLLAGLVLYRWVNELFGTVAASVSASLFFLNPNILAHGHLATVDAGSMMTLFVACYALHWAYRQPSGRRVALAGSAWGVALLTKFSAVLLLPVLCALVLLYRWRQWKRAGVELLWLLVTAWFVLNAGMGFKGSFSPLGSFNFVSGFAKGVQAALPASLPVPVPSDWVAGFDQQKLDTEQGEFGNYLFGQWSDHGWWYYNVVAFVVKNPLPLLALIVASPWFWRRARTHRLALTELLLPLTALLGSMMFFNRLNIGVRYLLPAFPFVFVLSASVWRDRRRWRPWLAGGVVAAHLLVAAWMFPGYLSYFNWAVGGPSRGHTVLLDSNLDWGQDLYRLPSVLRGLGVKGKLGLLYFGHVHPRVYGLDYELVPPVPGEGVYAVSLQYLMGGSYVATTPDWAFAQIEANHAAWLRQYQPVAKAGSIWIFDTRGKLRTSSR